MERAFPPNPDTLFWRLATLMCGVGFAALAVFSAVPEIDLWTAGMFYDGASFPLRSDPALVMLRTVYKAIFFTFCAGVALMVVLRLLAPGGWQTPLRLWLFFGAFMVTGPGLLVNALLKAHWGRARPDTVTAFGGPEPFTPPFAIGDSCTANCSFVSGEGAAAAALAFALSAAFWPSLRGGHGRWAAVAAIAVWLLGAAVIRMAPGKHFLSDTVFAFVLMAMTAAVLYRVFGMGRMRSPMTARAAAQDAARALTLCARMARRLWEPLANGHTRTGTATADPSPSRE